MHVAQLGRLYPQFQVAGAEILVILGDDLEPARKYGAMFKLAFPVLADPERAVYRRFGLEKAYFIIQRTASVVVDRDGMIRYLRRATMATTWRQESQELLEMVQQL